MLLAKNIAPRVLLGVALVVLLAGCAPERLAGTVFDQRPTRYGTSADVAASGPFALRTTPDFDDAPGGYAENWPSRPVTLVVSFLPGGNTDIYARVFVPFLEDALGQHINVVNIDGGAGTLGATLVSEAPSNGYTMLFYHTGNMFSNIIHAGTEINYDDFLISCVAVRCTTNVMLINADFGISTAQEFLAYARANPDVLRAATTGSGFSYTLTRMAEAIGDFRTTSINVGAMALMMDAVRGGDADIATVILAVAEPFIESGEMIPLWIAAGERHPSLPHVPTLAEIGIENGYIGNSYFFAFPPGTNPNIARRLSDALEEIVASPEFAQQMFDVARTPAYFVPFDYARDHLHNLWNELSAFEEYEE